MPPPAAPASTKEQVGAALQQAGQYGGGSTVWTPENVEGLGLDPSRGYIAPQFKAPASEPEQPAPPHPSPLPEPPPQPQTPQGTWNPAPWLKQFLETKVPIPPVWQPLPEHMPGGWNPYPELAEELHTPVTDLPKLFGKPPQTQEPAHPGPTPEDAFAAAGAKPLEEPKGVPSKPEDAFVAAGAKPLEEPKGAPPKSEDAFVAAGAKPLEEPKAAQQPAQAQPQPAQAQPSLTGPTPTPQGPTTTEAPDPHAQVQALIAQGKSPGEAQAIVAGQEPKTISGAAPKAKAEEVAPPPPTEKPVEQPPAAEKPAQRAAEVITTLKADAQNRVDPKALYSYLLGKFANSGVAGYVPPDGARWGIKTGSAAEWAAFALAVAKQESDLNARSYNSADPGGSAGLFQFGQGQKPYVQGDQFDPQQSADAFVRAVQHYLANKGSIANLGEIFGSIRRPNEAGQYIAGAQKVAAGGSGADLVSSGGAGGEGKAGGGKRSHAPGVPSGPEGPLAGQPWFGVEGIHTGAPSVPDQNAARIGGGGQQVIQEEGEGRGSSIYFGGFGRGGGTGQAAAPQVRQQPPEEEEDPMVTALTSRGFSRAQALKYVESMEVVAPGRGFAPREVQTPAASGAQKTTQALPVAQPSALPAPALSLLGKQPEIAPRKIPPVVPTKKTPTAAGTTAAAPAAPGVSQDDKKAVVQSLVGMGLQKSHAQELVASAQGNTVDEVLQSALKAHGKGAIHGVESGTFRPPAQTPAQTPTTSPAAQSTQPATLPAARPSRQAPAPLPPSEPESGLAREPAPYEPPRGSTHGVATPPGVTPGLELSKAVKEHAGLLSEDDPRVKKQADGSIKGEHFVEGDPIHDQLLEGLPEGKSGPQRQMLGQAETAIADKQPMHISYLSAPKEAQRYPTRESRTVQYDEHTPEARLMGTTVGQLVGHSFIPTAVGVSLPRKKGDPHQSYIQGISTNILANNFQHLNEKLASMGRETPYKSLGQKFFNDLQGYYSNLNAGHTGTGRGYAVGTEALPSEPDTTHVPYKLSRKETDFINTVINNTAAFAGHEDAQKLRDLAKANGTLITEAGETNRMRHNIEEHDPGWRKRVLEPSIRSFKTGLIVAHHRDERYFPETIRPGKEFQDLTRAVQQTSEKGRPDVPISVSLHHTFQDNRLINKIERDFSSHAIDEAEARRQLKDLGEDPDEYRFVGGSGGLVTPYEDDPESITPEEHTQMRDNLRNQWVNGKMGVDDYRKKAAEVPLPSKPSKLSKAAAPTAPAAPEEPEAAKETPAPAPIPKPKAQPKAQQEPSHVLREAGSDASDFDIDSLKREGHFYRGMTKDEHDATVGAGKGVQSSQKYSVPGEGTSFSDRPSDAESYANYGRDDPRKTGRPNYLVEVKGGDDIKYDKRDGYHKAPAGIPHERVTRAWEMKGNDKGQVVATPHPIGSPKQAPVEPQEEPEPSGGIQPPAAKPKPQKAQPPALGEAPKPEPAKPKFRPAKPEEFIAARDKSKRPQYLSALSPDDIREHKLFMSEDGKTGAAVSPEGDIQNVFNNGGPKGAGQHALVHAIEEHGGHTLDAFDPYLPELYSQFGFKETGRMKFKPEFAPPKWDHANDDSPDVVFMGHAGYPEGGKEGALARALEEDETKRIPYERGQNYSDDWDAQKEASRVHARGAGDHPSAGAGPAPGTHQAGGAPSAGAGEAYREPVEQQPPALGEAPPAPKPTISKAAIKKRLGPRPDDEEQGAIHDRVAGRIAKEIPGSIPMRPLRNKKGELQADEKGNPKWEPEEYNIANAPMLEKQGKAIGFDETGAVSKAPEGTKDELDPGDLYYLKQNKDGTPSDDRLRVSHLNKVSAVNSFADKLVDFFHSVKHDKEIMGAAGWYPEVEQMLREHFGVHANLAAHLLAATSAGTGVRPNFTMAMNALERYLHGDFDRHIDLYKKAHQMRQGGTLRQHVFDQGMLLDKDGKPRMPAKDTEAMAAYILHHDISPVQLHGPKFGFNSKAVLKVLANTWHEEAEGPKTVNYGGNLSGRSLQATIDMWAARTMRRLGYEGHTDKPWLYNPPAEGGVNNVDFALSQLAFREAAKRLDMQPRVLQAILWFAEQKHYQKQGWEKWVDPAERDYRPMLRSLMEHGPLTTHLPGKEPAPQGGQPRAPTHKTVPKVQAFAQGGLVQRFQDGGLVQPITEDPANVVQPMAGAAPRAQPPPGTVPKAQLVSEPAGYTGLPSYQGKATRFAGQDDLDRYNAVHDAAIRAGKSEHEAEQAGFKVGDNGRGAPALGTIDTTDSYGIAVPQETMEKFYGGKAKDPSSTANWRTARAEVTINGQTYRLPISDLGPSAKGAAVDLTDHTANAVGMGSSADNVRVKLLPPGSGPDYLKDPDAWFAEQAHFAKQFKDNPTAQISPEPVPTPQSGYD